MSVVWVKFASQLNPKEFKTGSLQSCPACGGKNLQRWGKTENLNPEKGDVLTISRFRCMDCGRTFSDPNKQILKQSYYGTIQSIAGMIWVLGISLRDIETLFQQLAMDISRSSIWRTGKDMLCRLECAEKKSERHVIDTIYVPGVSEKLGVVVGLELSDGRQVILGTLPELYPGVVKTCLEVLLANANIEIEISRGTAVHRTEHTQEYCPLVVSPVA